MAPTSFRDRKGRKFVTFHDTCCTTSSNMTSVVESMGVQYFIRIWIIRTPTGGAHIPVMFGALFYIIVVIM